MTTTTLEALQKLTGAELNARVARELGWEHVRYRSRGGIEFCVGNAPETPNIIDDVPDWAGDIGAAMALLATLPIGTEYLVGRDNLRSSGPHFYARIYRGNGGSYQCEHAALPTAIVLAFLLAAGEGA